MKLTYLTNLLGLTSFVAAAAGLLGLTSFAASAAGLESATQKSFTVGPLQFDMVPLSTIPGPERSAASLSNGDNLPRHPVLRKKVLKFVRKLKERLVAVSGGAEKEARKLSAQKKGGNQLETFAKLGELVKTIEEKMEPVIGTGEKVSKSKKGKAQKKAENKSMSRMTVPYHELIALGRELHPDVNSRTPELSKSSLSQSAGVATSAAAEGDSDLFSSRDLALLQLSLNEPRFNGRFRTEAHKRSKVMHQNRVARRLNSEEAVLRDQLKKELMESYKGSSTLNGVKKSSSLTKTSALSQARKLSFSGKALLGSAGAEDFADLSESETVSSEAFQKKIEDQIENHPLAKRVRKTNQLKLAQLVSHFEEEEEEWKEKLGLNVLGDANLQARKDRGLMEARKDDINLLSVNKAQSSESTVGTVEKILATTDNFKAVQKVIKRSEPKNPLTTLQKTGQKTKQAINTNNQSPRRKLSNNLFEVHYTQRTTKFIGTPQEDPTYFSSFSNPIILDGAGGWTGGWTQEGYNYNVGDTYWYPILEHIGICVPATHPDHFLNRYRSTEKHPNGKDDLYWGANGWTMRIIARDWASHRHLAYLAAIVLQDLIGQKVIIVNGMGGSDSAWSDDHNVHSLLDELETCQPAAVSCVYNEWWCHDDGVDRGQYLYTNSGYDEDTWTPYPDPALTASAWATIEGKSAAACRERFKTRGEGPGRVQVGDTDIVVSGKSLTLYSGRYYQWLSEGINTGRASVGMGGGGATEGVIESITGQKGNWTLLSAPTISREEFRALLSTETSGGRVFTVSASTYVDSQRFKADFDPENWYADTSYESYKKAVMQAKTVEHVGSTGYVVEVHFFVSLPIGTSKALFQSDHIHVASWASHTLNNTANSRLTAPYNADPNSAPGQGINGYGFPVGSADNLDIGVTAYFGGPTSVNMTYVEYDFCYAAKGTNYHGQFSKVDLTLDQGPKLSSVHEPPSIYHGVPYMRCNSMGRMIPPQCYNDTILHQVKNQGKVLDMALDDINIINTTKCSEIYGASPDWDYGWFETVIVMLELPYVLRYVGGEELYWKTLLKLQTLRPDLMLAYTGWKPDPVHDFLDQQSRAMVNAGTNTAGESKVLMMNLPVYETGCNGEGLMYDESGDIMTPSATTLKTGGKVCMEKVLNAAKMQSTRVGEFSTGAKWFSREMSVTQKILEQMLGYSTLFGGSLTADFPTACHMVQTMLNATTVAPGDTISMRHMLVGDYTASPPVNGWAPPCHMDLLDMDTLVCNSNCTARNTYCADPACLSCIQCTSTDMFYRNPDNSQMEKLINEPRFPTPDQWRCQRMCTVGNYLKLDTPDDVTNNRCVPAPVGYQASLVGLAAPELCPPGTVANTTGKVNCDDCPPGSYNGGTTAATKLTCDLCPAGQYQNVPGKHTCVVCSLGDFSPTAGASSCSHCPLGTYATSGSTTSCTSCVGEHRTTLYTRSVNSQACVCEDGYFYNFINTECEKCQDGLICTGGVTNYKTADRPNPSNYLGDENMPRLQPGYMSTPANPYSIFKCRDEKVCPGGAVGGTTSPDNIPCALGRWGYSCGLCRDGWTYGSNGECERCGDIKFAYIGLPLLFIAAMIFIFCHQYFAIHLSSTGSSIFLMRFNVLGIVLTTIQVVVGITRLEMQWGKIVDEFMTVFDFFQMDFNVMQLRCVFSQDNPVITAAAKCMALPFLLFLSVLMHQLVAFVFRIPPSWQRLHNCMGFVILMVYTSVVVAVVEPLHCLENPNGLFTVAKYAHVPCWGDEPGNHGEDSNADTYNAVPARSPSGDHTLMMMLSILGLVVLVAPFLYDTIYTCLKYNSNIIDPNEALNMMRAYQYLFLRFRHDRPYFMIIFLARNTAVAFVPILFNKDLGGACLAMAICKSLYLYFLMYLQPWREPLLNHIDAFISLGLLLLLTKGAMATPEIDGGGEIAAILLLAAFFFTLWVMIFSGVKPSISCDREASVGAVGAEAKGARKKTNCLTQVLQPNKKYDIYLCYDPANFQGRAVFLKDFIEKAMPGTRVYLAHDPAGKSHDDFLTRIHHLTVDSKSLLVLADADDRRLPYHNSQCVTEIALATRSGMPVEILSFRDPAYVKERTGQATDDNKYKEVIPSNTLDITFFKKLPFHIDKKFQGILASYRMDARQAVRYCSETATNPAIHSYVKLSYDWDCHRNPAVRFSSKDRPEDAGVSACDEKKTDKHVFYKEETDQPAFDQKLFGQQISKVIKNLLGNSRRAFNLAGLACEIGDVLPGTGDAGALLKQGDAIDLGPEQIPGIVVIGDLRSAESAATLLNLQQLCGGKSEVMLVDQSGLDEDIYGAPTHPALLQGRCVCIAWSRNMKLPKSFLTRVKRESETKSSMNPLEDPVEPCARDKTKTKYSAQIDEAAKQEVTVQDSSNATAGDIDAGNIDAEIHETTFQEDTRASHLSSGLASEVKEGIHLKPYAEEGDDDFNVQNVQGTTESLEASFLRSKRILFLNCDLGAFDIRVQQIASLLSASHKLQFSFANRTVDARLFLACAGGICNGEGLLIDENSGKALVRTKSMFFIKSELQRSFWDEQQKSQRLTRTMSVMVSRRSGVLGTSSQNSGPRAKLSLKG